MFLEITLILIILSLSYICYNLFRKNEMYEDTIEEYDKWFSEFDSSVKDTEFKLREIDNKGTFESDDEVGQIFKQLQNIIEELEKELKGE